jgi:S-adenosylmethionine decarboxylase proenzyme
MVGTFGRHLLAEYYGCAPAVLDDQQQVRALLRRAAEAAGASVVAEVIRPFAPQGVSGLVVVEESHLAIHTWPETGYAAVDFYSCGDCRLDSAHGVLREGLAAERSELMVIHRGLSDAACSLRVDEHRQEETESATLPLFQEG